MTKIRCAWVTQDEAYQKYHDTEWGVPVKEDAVLFEFLVLESFQAGLSWLTVLRKREHFRSAFDQFDASKIALYTQEKIDNLLQDQGIIRHRGKIEATIHNASLFIAIQKTHGSFADYLWGFVNHQPLLHQYETIKEVPARTELSDEIAKDLKKRGFKFMGSTTVYAYLQAVGIVNDHTTDCFCRANF